MKDLIEAIATEKLQLDMLDHIWLRRDRVLEIIAEHAVKPFAEMVESLEARAAKLEEHSHVPVAFKPEAWKPAMEFPSSFDLKRCHSRVGIRSDVKPPVGTHVVKAALTLLEKLGELLLPGTDHCPHCTDWEQAVEASKAIIQKHEALGVDVPCKNCEGSGCVYGSQTACCGNFTAHGECRQSCVVEEQTKEICPECNGVGHRRTPKALTPAQKVELVREMSKAAAAEDRRAPFSGRPMNAALAIAEKRLLGKE